MSQSDRRQAVSRLERDAMVWPPAEWERPAGSWREDLWSGPEPFMPYDAGHVAAPGRALPTPRPDYRLLVREVLETLVLTALIFLGIRMVVQNFRIEGRSMLPTLHEDQYLLVNKLVYRGFGEPQRGDIIVFEAWNADKDFIKRVVGLPGEEIHIHDGAVYVNDVPLTEPYLRQPTNDTIGPVTLAPNTYYVMGDNRVNSSDSRSHGPLSHEKIVGKAWVTYWPPGEVGLIPDSHTSFASSPADWGPDQG